MNKQTWIVYTNTNEEWWFWADPKADVIKEFNDQMISSGSKLRGVDYYSADCSPVEMCG